MSSEPLQPTSPAELAETVRSAARVLVVGAGTKPRLSAVAGITRISTARLTGILDYDSTEFTFTALAGTPLREIVATLGQRGQYLPFDPPFAAAGATLGGTVASGLSGAGRFRFGGIRDFILGIRFVDGEGRLLRMGGKVVKNAAGFDLPKFFVGSLGRFGALAEITIKVFPKPSSTLTLKLPVTDPTAMARMLADAGSARWELDALDASLVESTVYARLAGPANGVEALAKEILQRWPGQPLSPSDANTWWENAATFLWAHAPDGVLLKIPLSPSQLAAFALALRGLPESKISVSAGGNVAFLSLPIADPDKIRVVGEKLRALHLSALTLRGEAPLWLGKRPSFNIHRTVKRALDPQNRFPSLDD